MNGSVLAVMMPALVAGPAMAAPDYVAPTHDAVYSTHSDSATFRPVDCSVHVSSGGNDVNANWC